MRIPALRLRWINYACYEIVLPDQKRIVIDPCIDFTKEVPFSAEDFGKVDYILLSHTHYDHTMEIGNILKGSKPKIIVGSLSAYDLCKFFEIDFDQIYPVAPNETLEFDGFTLDVYRGKHTSVNSTDGTNTINRRKFGAFPAGHHECDIYGSIEYMNYLITTGQNVRILNWGGPKETVYFNNIFTIAKKMAPNIIIKQLSTKYTPEEFAETMAILHPQIVLPLHQDGVDRKGTITAKEYIARANTRLEELGSQTRIVDPPQYEFLDFYMGVDHV